MNLQKTGLGLLAAAFCLIIMINPAIFAQSENDKVAALEADGDYFRQTLGGGPEDYNLEFNLPNPFTTNTTIRFAIPAKNNLAVKVYNNNWEVVRTLVNGEVDKGFYKVDWDGKNDQGQQVAHGIYYYRLKADAYDQVGKMYFLD